MSSEKKWNQEPWHDFEEEHCYQHRPEDEDTVELNKAHYERAKECVNACAGMDDPAAEIAQLRQQRDSLLAALKPLEAHFRSGNSIPVERATIRASDWAAVTAALAKVTP